MKKHHVIPIIILLVVIAGFAAVYQIYVKEQIQEFQENEQRLQALRTRIEQFHETFKGADGTPVKPEVAVSQYRNQVQPFAEAVRRQSRYFHFGDSMDDVPLVPEGAIPKYHYTEEMPKQIYALRQYALSHNTVLTGEFMFGAPKIEDMKGANPTEEEVNKWLREYQFGFNVVKMLVDAGAARINYIEIWPEYEDLGLLRMRTVGLQFQMTVENLAEFLKDFYGEDRYFNINGLRIQNTNLLSRTKPLLNVEMVLTQAGFLEENAAAGMGSAPAGGGGGGGSRTASVGPASAEDVLAQLRNRGGLLRGRGEEGEGNRRQVGQPWWKMFWPF